MLWVFAELMCHKLTGPCSAVVSTSDCGSEKIWGSNPIRVMWDFSALAGSCLELGVLWAQWEGWNHTAQLHPLHRCIFEGVSLIDQHCRCHSSQAWLTLG